MSFLRYTLLVISESFVNASAVIITYVHQVSDLNISPQSTPALLSYTDIYILFPILCNNTYTAGLRKMFVS